MAFAWIEPAADAEVVTVRHPGFLEVYEVAADLPVRVATTMDLVLEESRGSFDVSEHDGRGTLLRTYAVEARAAG